MGMRAEEMRPSAEVGKAQAKRSGMEGSSGYSLTTSRLQRLARGAFFWLASGVLRGGAGWGRGSDWWRPITVTGG